MELDPDNVPEIEDLVSVCAGLVVVDPESDIIRLVHYTAQEYFERIRKDWNPSALLEITSTCLTYLCFDAFKYGRSTTDEEFEDRLRQNKFLDYAAKHWGEHAVTVEDEACEQVCSFLLLSAHPVRPKLQNEAARCGYQRFSIGWPKTSALGPPPCCSAANGRNRERRPIAETPSV